ncbi:MAG TPA: aspartate--ammonia ligase [Firmicutes bacterium]|nr:aspartate--ammonia ligase [Bacillota bacterium]
MIIPASYTSKLTLKETQEAIKLIKDFFERVLARQLNLTRVSAPLFVPHNSGLNDNLTGVERPIIFDVPAMNSQCEIIHSLAKWKRRALKEYNFRVGEGLYTDMNAIRRDEILDNLHSLYVDQWDWERIITAEDRNLDFLHGIVDQIYLCLKETEREIHSAYPMLEWELPESITFITTQELEDLYPHLDPKRREDAITKDKKAVFLTQIGGELASGIKHDGRAPDYDDWNLNGDILVWHPILQQALELSSMGIRVDRDTMLNQLKTAGCEHWVEYQFHRDLLAGKLPLTIGGGIGQSRLCMYFLEKVHIGEVQASTWPKQIIEMCRENNIFIL